MHIQAPSEEGDTPKVLAVGWVLGALLAEVVMAQGEGAVGSLQLGASMPADLWQYTAGTVGLVSLLLLAGVFCWAGWLTVCQYSVFPPKRGGWNSKLDAADQELGLVRNPLEYNHAERACLTC